MAYGKNHTATSSYLAGWAGLNGQLRAVRADEIESEGKKPENVGFRRNFWSDDPTVREAAEKRAGALETRAVEVLRQLPGLWPLAGVDEESPSWALACFMALHVLRNEAGFDHMQRAQHVVLERRTPHYREQLQRPGQHETFLREVTSDSFRANRVMDSVLTLASILASMHWTLIEVDERLLATSDQPVTFVPLLPPGRTALVTAIPRGSLLDCEEVRFAVSPRHALLLTWIDQPWTDVMLRGTDRVVSQLNRAVIAQANRQWFHHPDRRPVTVTPDSLALDNICLPVGRELHDGYGPGVAQISRRRADTARCLEQAIEDGTYVTVVSVDRSVAA